MPSIEDVADALLPGGRSGASADDCKELGNSMLSSGKVEDAIWLYTLALEKRPGCHLLASNRSAARAKLGYWSEALADAEQCIEANPEWARGYGRKGAALEGLKRFVDAKKAYQRALKLEPENENTKRAIQGLQEQIAKEGLQEADEDEEGDLADEDAVAARKQAQEDKKKEKIEALKAKVTQQMPNRAKGNKAFAASNFEDAISFFSDAIELDKGNHVLYSNRSAAYCSVNQFGAALNDAQKCVNLSPAWAKGYGRKAAALVGLGRMPQAVDAYRRGLQTDPNNAMLLQGLAELRGPVKEEKTEEGEAAAVKAEDGTEVKKEGTTEREGAGAVKEEVKEETKPAPEPMDEMDMELLSEFLSETSDLERKQQVERIIKHRLNPFEVLLCKPEMTEDEINAGYRKISLMVHPDKCKHPRAEEAFGVCKKALAELQEEEKRQFYVGVMEAARQEAERELKKRKRKEKEDLQARKKIRTQDVDKLRSALLGGGAVKKKKTEEEATAAGADDEEFSKEDEDMLEINTKEAALRILTQLEKRRARAERVYIENDKRSKAALQDMKHKHNAEEKVEEQWNKDRLDRIDSWRDFQAHGTKLGIKKPKPAVTEKGVSVLPPTMGGIQSTKEEEDLLKDFLGDA